MRHITWTVVRHIIWIVVRLDRLASNPFDGLAFFPFFLITCGHWILIAYHLIRFDAYDTIRYFRSFVLIPFFFFFYYRQWTFHSSLARDIALFPFPALHHPGGSNSSHPSHIFITRTLTRQRQQPTHPQHSTRFVDACIISYLTSTRQLVTG